MDRRHRVMVAGMPQHLATARASILTPIALAAAGAVPEWIMILPAGPQLRAVDGRSWTIEDPDAVAAASMLDGLDLPIDWEHAQDHRAPKGEEAPAAGWIDRIEVRDGAQWAHVDWTEKGRRSIAGRDYRYISPTFLHDKAGRIARIIGAGLVNRPAFNSLPALAQQSTTTEDTMKSTLAALGLAETATEADATAAVTKLKTDLVAATASAQTPSLEKFVPRADYDQVLQRATAAEQKLTERDRSDLDARVTTLIDGAVAAGKIAPASKPHYVALAQKDFAQVEGLLATAPQIVKPSGLDDPGRTTPPAGTLDEVEKAMCRQLGLSEADYLKTKTAEAA
ncbi:Uncharacterised protein [Starkeya nomas]|uniref:Mu-like prophage I protein n=2 Tax=Starkeya nomas TaxID=2666134 RepID=A0A5S9R6L6_9HYPH|nr:Uncharacterised protein [Starkeya nomas]